MHASHDFTFLRSACFLAISLRKPPVQGSPGLSDCSPELADLMLLAQTRSPGALVPFLWGGFAD